MKGEFEKNKKQLELMIKEIRDSKDEQAKKAAAAAAHNTSVTSGGPMGSNEKARATSNTRGKSQGPGGSQGQTPT